MKVKCQVCGKEFEKLNYEVKRSKNHTCSRKCASQKAINVRFGKSVGFGYYNNSCKKRAKKKNFSFNLNPKYLKGVFDGQKGLCAISGLEMTMNKNDNDKSISHASLDRIDNNKGYIKGNVQFVCMGINYMRNNFSMGETLDFIKKIKEK